MSNHKVEISDEGEQFGESIEYENELEKKKCRNCPLKKCRKDLLKKITVENLNPFEFDAMLQEIEMTKKLLEHNHGQKENKIKITCS